MRFDTIIIGGGLSGLTCGIKLQESGRKVAVVSAGQSTLLFGGGSLELLGYSVDGTVVKNPVEAIKELPAAHPYKKIDDIAVMAEEAKALLGDCGFATVGNAHSNHFRMSPVGVRKPAWLTAEGMLTFDDASTAPWKEVLLVGIEGFLDMPMEFIRQSLLDMSCSVDVEFVTIPALSTLRHSPSEMRSTNVAKIVSTTAAVNELAEEINKVKRSRTVLMPAAIGLRNAADKWLREKVQDLYFVATIPPSTHGARLQAKLADRFQRLGGTLFIGDKAMGGDIKDGRLLSITTEKLQDEYLVADNYVLASGSFVSRGLTSNYLSISETVFGVDVDASMNRADWTSEHVFDAQPYLEYGVKTDTNFNTYKAGLLVENLYAVGSILSGHNAQKFADGTGVSIITALQVARNILRK